MPAIPIAIARRRTALVKRGLAFGSAVAFAATIALAQSSHPATAATSAPTTTTTTTTTTTSSSSGTNTSVTSSFGQAQVSPTTSSQTPSVSTGAS